MRELFEELGVLHDGVWEERYLCFSPQERVFAHGEWHDGIEPEFALDAVGRAAFSSSTKLIAAPSRERRVHDPNGRRRATRVAAGSDVDGRLAQATSSSTTPAMRWYIDYACRDDYGALARADVGVGGRSLLRVARARRAGPLTWPEGNGWIVKRLIAKLAQHIRPARARGPHRAGGHAMASAQRRNRDVSRRRR